MENDIKFVISMYFFINLNNKVPFIVTLTRIRRPFITTATAK